MGRAGQETTASSPPEADRAGGTWTAWREAFAIARTFAHLDIANKAPLPEPVRAAAVAFLREHAESAGDKDAWKAVAERLRAGLAALVRADPDEIAFVANTSAGLNLIARSLPLGPGDEVVVPRREHPNHLVAWLNLRRAGVEVRTVGTADGALDLAPLLAAIGPATRVVAVSHVSYCTGARLDLARLSRACRDAGALLVVDGVQAVGIVDVDVRAAGVDAYVCGGQKGLMSLHGLGFLYCRRGLAERLSPVFAARSSLSVPDPTRAALAFHPDARRFEHGNLNYAAVHALDAAVAMIRARGPTEIEARIAGLVDRILAGADRLGLAVSSPRRPSERAGIVTLRVPAAPDIAAALHVRGILTSAIDGDLRVAPCPHLDESDIDRFLDALAVTLRTPEGR